MHDFEVGKRHERESRFGNDAGDIEGNFIVVKIEDVRLQDLGDFGQELSFECIPRFIG